jgi:hypothetical protein
MSATKELLHTINQAQDEADLALLETTAALFALGNLAWANGIDRPVWAPDQAWLDSTKVQLAVFQEALAELQAARDCHA